MFWVVRSKAFIFQRPFGYLTRRHSGAANQDIFYEKETPAHPAILRQLRYTGDLKEQALSGYLIAPIIFELSWVLWRISHWFKGVGSIWASQRISPVLSLLGYLGESRWFRGVTSPGYPSAPRQHDRAIAITIHTHIGYWGRSICHRSRRLWSRVGNSGIIPYPCPTMRTPADSPILKYFSPVQNIFSHVYTQ